MEKAIKLNQIMDYILPVNPFPYKEVVDYIILKVEVEKEALGDCYMCKVLEVVREETGNGYYNYCMKENFLIGCSRKYLYPITNKFKKEKKNEQQSNKE